MKECLLLGASLNSGNKGVNALTRGQINLLLEEYGEDINIKIISFTVNSQVNNIINYNNLSIQVEEIPCGKKKIIETFFKCIINGRNDILQIINESNIILDISEGDSFSDIYGFKRFIQHTILKIATLKLKKKLILMPQTLGPYKNCIVKLVARYILNKANYVFVRDDLSKTIVKKDLKVNRPIIYTPDMAFYMIPDKNVSMNKFIRTRDKVIVGINISALLYNGGYNKKNMFGLNIDYKDLIDNIIHEFLKIHDVEIILIPHVMTKENEVEDDFRLCKKIVNKIEKKVNRKIYTLDKYYREDEIKAIIQGCDFFIGSRMHACIGAISTLVPTVPIAYSRKFIGIWDKIGLGYCVTDPRKQNQEDILYTIKNMFIKRNEIKDKLNAEIPLLKKDIEKIMDVFEEN